MREGPASLRLALAELRDGPISREQSLESPHAAMGGLPDALGGPLVVRIRADLTGGGGVRVVGHLSAAAALECRRCLSPLRCEIESRLEAWFRSDRLAGPEEEGVWAFDPDAAEIDLREAIREELWLAVPEYAICRPDCPGLCPRCGARLETEECACPPEGPDPRWAALEASSRLVDRSGG